MRHSKVPTGYFNDPALNELSKQTGLSASTIKSSTIAVGSIKWDRVTVVGKSQTYTTITEAINDSKADEFNPWLILVLPGKYNESVILKDYVNVVGLGDINSVIVCSDIDGMVTPATCRVHNIVFKQLAPSTTTSTVLCTASCTLAVGNGSLVTYNFHNGRPEYDSPPPGLVPLITVTTNEEQRGVLGFDFSSISGPVSSATLTVNVVDTGYGSSVVTVYPIKRTVVDTQATWNIYSTGNSWGTAGCSGTSDRDGSNTSSYTMTTDTGIKSYSITTAVSSCVINGYSYLLFIGSNQYGKSITPDGLTGEPYITVTYTPSISIIKGNTKSTVFSMCKFTGDSSYSYVLSNASTGSYDFLHCEVSTVSKGFISSAVNTIKLQDCKVNCNNNHIEVSGGGTVSSYTNVLNGSGTHLVNTAGTLRSCADDFTTSSGTITYIGGVDSVDGHHIVYDADYKAYLI